MRLLLEQETNFYCVKSLRFQDLLITAVSIMLMPVMLFGFRGGTQGTYDMLERSVFEHGPATVLLGGEQVT